MAFGIGAGIVDAIAGAVSGAGQGMAESSLLEQKAQIETLREERLSQLRMREHAANTQSDIKARADEASVNAARTGDFFKSSALPSTPIINQASATFDTDDGQGTSTSNPVTTMDQPSHRAQAANYASKALATGRPEIIKAANEYQGDVLKAEDMDRKQGLEASRIALEAGRNKYYDALAAKYQAETDVLAQGGKTIPAPMLQSKQDDDGHNYLLDTHSGAIGKIVPGQAETKAETHWFSADTPGKPAVPMHVDWTTSDGNPIQGGIDALYPAWAASRNKQLGAKRGVIDNAADSGAALTSDVAAQATSDGIQPSGAAAPAPMGAPAPGTIVKGYRFKGGDPHDKNAWEKVK